MWILCFDFPRFLIQWVLLVPERSRHRRLMGLLLMIVLFKHVFDGGRAEEDRVGPLGWKQTVWSAMKIRYAEHDA